MNLSKKVEDVISSSLVSVSKKSDIDLKELRLELFVTSENDVVIKKMKKSDYVPDFENCNIPWKEVLGLTLSVFKGTVKDKIINALSKIEMTDGYDEKSLSCRIYAINSQGKPKLHLYKNGKPLREIDFEQILD